MSNVKVLHKYKLDSNDVTVRVTRNHTIRHVDFQGDDLCVWIEEDISQLHEFDKASICFKSFCTGEEFILNSNMRFIGTSVSTTHKLVIHTFAIDE